MRPLVVLLAAGTALATAIPGCATSGAARIRKERLQHELDGFAYQKPLDDVWQEARRLLAERSFQLADKDAEAVGQRPMSWTEAVLSPARETGPAQEAGLLQRMGVVKGSNPGPGQALDTGWNQYGERYHLVGWSEKGGCRVIFTYIRQDRTDRHTEETRDLETELDLMRRVDPAAAERIEKSVEAPAAG